MSGGPNTIVNAPNRDVERQKYDGTNAIEIGEGYFHDSDEVNVVVGPSVAAARRFAGVSMENQQANATRNYIDIAMAGSKSAQIAVAENVSIGDELSALVADGKCFFVKGGIAGASSAVAKEATTAVKLSILDNKASMAVDGITATVDDTSDLEAGMTVQILSSQAGGLTAGKYTIASVTNSTVFVLSATSEAGTLLAAAAFCMCAYTVRPLVYAEIMTGKQTSGVQYINGVAATLTTTGVTVCQGNLALAGHIAITIGAGEQGDVKIIKMGAAGISGGFLYKVTPSSAVSLVVSDGTTALATADLTNASTAVLSMQYIGTTWFLTKIVGITETT